MNANYHFLHQAESDERGRRVEDLQAQVQAKDDQIDQQRNEIAANHQELGDLRRQLEASDLLHI